MPKRKNGKERWWHVPFLGRYREDKTFSWILRPELKEAIKEKYFYLEDEEEEVNISEPINYWWLTADPNIWSFDNVKLDKHLLTHLETREEIKRIYRNFENVKKGTRLYYMKKQ